MMDGKYRVNIKKFLAPEKEALRRCYAGVEKELKRLPANIRKSGDLPDILEELKDATEDGDARWFNSALEYLQDSIDEIDC